MRTKTTAKTQAKAKAKTAVRTLNKTQVEKAARLHEIEVDQLRKAAIAIGWDPYFVNSVANLEWTTATLTAEAKQCKATKKQTQVLLDLHQACRLELAGMFALSQL